jgi:hypothetical protein
VNLRRLGFDPKIDSFLKGIPMKNNFLISSSHITIHTNDKIRNVAIFFQ